SACACAAASAACLAWYSARPCLSSWDHDWTCAICAAWTRWACACCNSELRSNAVSCDTATVTDCWAGGARRGRTTVTSITTHTRTARNSGSKPLLRSFLGLAHPGGVRPELGATAWRGRAQELRGCHLTTRPATFSCRTPGYRDHAGAATPVVRTGGSAYALAACGRAAPNTRASMPSSSRTPAR